MTTLGGPRFLDAAVAQIYCTKVSCPAVCFEGLEGITVDQGSPGIKKINLPPVFVMSAKRLQLPSK